MALVAIEKGDVKPDDPVATLLPATVKVSSRNGRQITLLDLSSRCPACRARRITPADPASPYADYDAAKLNDFRSRHTLTRSPARCAPRLAIC